MATEHSGPEQGKSVLATEKSVIGACVELRQQAKLFLDNLWATNYTGAVDFEENWRRFERRYPGAKALHTAIAALTKE